MKIGFVGLGKLGLPCAVSISLRGHEVMGCDLDPSRMSKDPQPYQESGPWGNDSFNDYLAKSHIEFGTMKEVAEYSDIIFLAVQTPHKPEYEGITPMPRERVDFDYTALCRAVQSLSEVCEKEVVVVVISTCLPGTIRREIVPLLKPNMKLVYNPFFIAMGTTMKDFLNPEFILLGVEDEKAALTVQNFYRTIHKDPIFHTMSIESAELTKVSYNTFISLKIAFANTVMEICENFPKADCDDVANALRSATDRLISGAYLSGGMGDGGGCHPRDNIAMSWLARKHHLSFDIFDTAMTCREKQAEWLAWTVRYHKLRRKLPVVILGYAFKPETNLIVGSPALLVSHYLKEMGIKHRLEDAHIDIESAGYNDPASVYLIGCKHPEYVKFEFPEGSVVIDPHRYIPDQEGVEVIRIGEGHV